MGLITKIFGTYSQRELKSIYPIADKIEALADEVMREEMLVRFSYAHVTDGKDLRSGKLLGFDKWCHEAVRLIMLPDDISEEELIRFMRRDLKKVYDEKVAECTE